MRKILGLRIPFAEHNAGKRICWDCPGHARGNCVSSCARRTVNVSGQPQDNDRMREPCWTCDTAGWEDREAEDACIWDLVRFLVTTE